LTELDYRTPEVTGADEYPTLSNPNQIRAVVERVKVFVPQWKCHVWVHELTGERARSLPPADVPGQRDQADACP